MAVIHLSELPLLQQSVGSPNDLNGGMCYISGRVAAYLL